MFHAVAGVIVGSEVNQECVGIKLRWSPHPSLRTHDLFDVANQCRALSTFVSQRVHHDVIRLPVNLKLILGPIRSDFGRSVDHHVPVRKPPLTLVGLLGPTINHAPTNWWINDEFDGVRLVIHDVHENRAAIVIGMTTV